MKLIFCVAGNRSALDYEGLVEGCICTALYHFKIEGCVCILAEQCLITTSVAHKFIKVLRLFDRMENFVYCPTCKCLLLEHDSS